MYIYIYFRALRSRSLRDGPLSQRPLSDLCSLVFGATRLKETTKKITSEISMLEYHFGCWNQVNPTILKFVYFMLQTKLTNSIYMGHT